MHFKSSEILHPYAKHAKHLIFPVRYLLDAGEVNNQIGLQSGTQTQQLLRQENRYVPLLKQPRLVFASAR